LFSATMPSSVKNFIKIGMRNPFFVEVKSDHGDILAFTNEGVIEETGINVQSFAKMEENKLDKQVNEISELPSGLQNFYLSVAD